MSTNQGKKILVLRLAEFLNPFEILDLKPTDIPNTQIYPSYESNYLQRDRIYHIGRIAFFRDQCLSGNQSDPLSLDNVCAGGRVYPEPVLLDGHHRFCGALLAKSKHIRVFYGGRTDLLAYLQGKRKNPPLF